MKRLWLAFECFIESNTGIDPLNRENDISFWKDRLFINFCKYFLPVSLIALLPGIYFSLHQGFETIAIVDSTSFLLLAFIFTSSKLSIKLKKISVIAVIYLLSIFLVATLGYMGPGILYFFAVTILTTLILPISYAYWSIAVNAVIIAVFAFIIHFKLFHSLLIGQFMASTWLTVNANLVFLNIVCVLLIRYIFNSLQFTILSKDQVQRNYKDIFDLSPLPMFLFDVASLQFLNVNEAAIRHYGYSREEFLNKTVKDIHPLGERNEIEQKIRENARKGYFFRGVVNHIKNNGERIDVKIETNIIDYNGVAAKLVLATNVTEQVKNEQEILQSNQRLKAAQQIGKMGYWSYDCKTQALFLSDEVYAMFGKTQGDIELSIPSFEQGIHPDDWQQVVDTYTPSFIGQKNREIEYRMIRPELPINYIYQIATYVYDEEQALVKIEGITQDITESKLSQIKMKESEFNLRAIFESAVEGFFLLDANSVVKTFNSKAEKFVALTMGGLQCEAGRSILDFMAASRKENFSYHINEVLKGKIVEYDNNYQRADELTYWIRFIITPVYEGSKVVGACVSTRDVTLRKNYIQTIEEQNKAFHEISWTQSHMVRAPLCRIMALTTLLQDIQSDKEKMETLQYLQISSNELDDIIKKITELTTQTAEVFKLEDKPYSAAVNLGNQ
jgi:PAS domain S-box-containing protein